MRTTGWPARSSRSTERVGCRIRRAGERRWMNTRSRPYTSGGPVVSPSIGMIPLPCLPSDSATSCSSHAAEAGEPGGAISVGLSRPCQRELAEHHTELERRNFRARRTHSAAPCRARDRAAVQDRRPAARPARGRSSTAPSSGRRRSGCPGKSRESLPASRPARASSRDRWSARSDGRRPASPSCLHGPMEKMLLEDIHFERRPRLRRHEKQRPAKIDRAFHRQESVRDRSSRRRAGRDSRRRGQ